MKKWAANCLHNNNMHLLLYMYIIRQITRHECSWLKSKDFHRLYSQLTKCALLTQEEFEEWFDTVQNNDCFVLFGVVTRRNPQLIGLGTVWLHPRYYRSRGMSAHLEDIVIDEHHQHLGLGRKLVEKIKSWCKDRGCYKIQLNCQSELQEFYKSLGFKSRVTGMELPLNTS
jgi:glucosamine-phosphate N-acetyltransferase